MEREFDALFRDMAEQGYGMQDNVLPDQLLQELYASAYSAWEQGLFEQARVGPAHRAQRIPSIRGDSICWLEPDTDEPAQRHFHEWTETLRRHLNREFFLGLQRSELHFAHYEPGQGYSRHFDQHRGQPHRRITLIVYLTPERRPEDGGELCLYRPEKPEEEWLRIAPERGRVVLFRSDMIPHAVLPTHRDRWSVTGWFRDDPL
jgi:Predicted proline hydroxylase